VSGTNKLLNRAGASIKKTHASYARLSYEEKEMCPI
jgi:hypothetical protein